MDHLAGKLTRRRILCVGLWFACCLGGCEQSQRHPAPNAPSSQRPPGAKTPVDAVVAWVEAIHTDDQELFRSVTRTGDPELLTAWFNGAAGFQDVFTAIRERFGEEGLEHIYRTASRRSKEGFSMQLFPNIEWIRANVELTFADADEDSALCIIPDIPSTSVFEGHSLSLAKQQGRWYVFLGGPEDRPVGLPDEFAEFRRKFIKSCIAVGQYARKLAKGIRNGEVSRTSVEDFLSGRADPLQGAASCGY